MGREPVVMELGTGRWRVVYETTMVVLALVVVALLPMSDEGVVRVVNLAVWGVFVVDYFTRLALSTDRRGFMRRNVVDLIAILPADFFRAARALRVARLFRVIRAGSILFRVTRDVRGVLRTNALGWVLGVSAGVVLAGALAVWTIEPSIDSLPDAVWWAAVTATTVGYGDLSPEHGLARLVAVILMLVGIGTIGMLTGSIATYFLGDQAGSNPDVEHVRARLADWDDLDRAERARLAAMLEAMARTDEQSLDEPSRLRTNGD